MVALHHLRQLLLGHVGQDPEMRSTQDGRRMANISLATSDSWTDKGNVADALARYEGWHPTVRGLISAFPETYIWALHDRLPLPRWSDRRVTLLGDACHPMLPMMAQGAAQASVVVSLASPQANSLSPSSAASARET